MHVHLSIRLFMINTWDRNAKMANQMYVLYVCAFFFGFSASQGRFRSRPGGLNPDARPVDATALVVVNSVSLCQNLYASQIFYPYESFSLHKAPEFLSLSR